MHNFRDLWAKSARDGEKEGESLLQHTLNVLDAIIALHKRCPQLSDICRMPRLWHRLALAVAIHDLGKAAPWFQDVLREERKASLGRHEVLSLAYVQWLVGDDPHDDAPWIAAAVASHHKDIAEIRQRYSAPPATSDEPDMLVEFVHTCGAERLDRGANLFWQEILPRVEATGLLDPDWQRPAGPPLAGQLMQQAATTIRRGLDAWNELVWEFEPGGMREKERIAGRFARGLIHLADHAGSAAVPFKTLPHWKYTGTIEQLFGPPPGKNRYEHQTQALETDGHALLIAPTGSGKTEAAMLWAARQYREMQGSPPLFYVLPYKASMNAMRRRLAEKFCDDSVALQHSSAQQVLYAQLLDRDYSPRHAAWLARRQHSLGRLHAAPVRVLSPYQILRAAYSLKGHEAIWTDTASGLFVFDEIHAYDPNRLGQILETIRHLVCDLTARAFVMTATLPPFLRKLLSEILGIKEPIKADDATFKQFQRHRLHLWDADLLDPSIIREIAERARRREAVLVVATTVGRAQEVRRRLHDELGSSGDVRLLHSRFSGRDRTRKEMDLQKLVATRIDPSARQPVVLVATQVVEVSLDVDFDVLYSDPAPIEALVQRFGRVNRGRRHKERDVIVMTGIPERSPVYPEGLVRAALEQLRPCNGEMVDERLVQTWLDNVYAGDVGACFDREVRKQAKQFSHRVLSSLKPFESSEDLESLFLQMFEGTEVLPKPLIEEYRAAMEREPLEGPQYLVPVTSKQLKRLWGEGRAHRPEAFKLPPYGPQIVDAHYDSDQGLRIDLPAAEDDT